MPTSYQWDAVSLFAVLAAPIVLLVAVAAARQWPDRVARALFWFTVAILVWIVGFAFELAATDAATLWLWLRIEFIGIIAAGPLWLLVVLRYLDLDRRLGRLLVPLLTIPPALGYLALITNDAHHLFYQSLTPGAYVRGPLFWLNAAIGYSYFCVAFAVTLASAARAGSVRRRRLLTLVVASAIPFVGNVVYVGLNLPSRFDPTPMLFAIAGALMVEALTRGRLLQARPVALRTALAVANDAIVVADVDGRIVESNPAAARLIGARIAGQLGGLLALLGASSTDSDLLTRHAPGTRLLRSDGRVLEAQTMPVVEDERPVGVVAWLRDVTERERLIDQLNAARAELEARVEERTAELQVARRHADAQAAELAATLAAIPDGIVVADAAGRPLLVNDAARALLGVPLDPDRPLGDQLAALVPDAPAAEEEEPSATIRDLLADGAPATREVSVARSSGRPRHLVVSAAPILDGDGQVIGRVVALHDISQLRQWERARNEFLAMSAHELRSPVTGITLAAQLLQRRTAQLPDDLRAQHAETTLAILRQARRLRHLVNDLLDSARLEGGLLTMQPERFDLGALARRLADEAVNLGVARVVVEAPETALLAFADPARVEQIIANLLDNARKYGPPDCPIVLTVAADGGAARVAVRDEGPGIPADELPRLFERFFRASNVADSTTGLGLGLALSRELARRMGGDLTVATTEGQGSTFTLTLPQAEK